jgi:hypothetical protein
MEIITIILFSPILLVAYLWQVAEADWWQRLHLVMLPVIFFVAAGKAYLGVLGGIGAIVVSTPFLIWALRRI